MSEANNGTNSVDPDDNTPYAWESPLHATQIVKSPEELRLLSERLFSRLAELGISKVTIGFSSWNGDGFIKHMLTERSSANTSLSLKEAGFDGKAIYFAIEEFIFSQLNASHSDWLKEDGSFGTYTLDVAHREVHENFVVRETGVQDVPEDDERYERLKDGLFDRLAALGVARVTADCEGGGDMGEVVSVETTMEPDRIAPFLEETEFEGKPLLDAVKELVLVTLTAENPGWELDWGSDATYTLDVPEREVVCEAFVEFEEEEDDEDEEGDGDEDEDGIDGEDEKE